MNKSTKKRNTYNVLVIEQLCKKFGFSKAYIRQCLDGTRKAIVADTIQKEYKELVNKVSKALNS